MFLYPLIGPVSVMKVCVVFIQFSGPRSYVIFITPLPNCRGELYLSTIVKEENLEVRV